MINETYLLAGVTKVCSNCHQEKPLELFPVHIGHSFDRSGDCKLCHAKKSREWYRNNKERAKRNVQRWAETHRQRSNEIKKRWDIKHPEARLATTRRYYLAHKEEMLEKQRQRRRSYRNYFHWNDFTYSPDQKFNKCPRCGKYYPEECEICLPCRVVERQTKFV